MFFWEGREGCFFWGEREEEGERGVLGEVCCGVCVLGWCVLGGVFLGVCFFGEERRGVFWGVGFGVCLGC